MAKSAETQRILGSIGPLIKQLESVGGLVSIIAPTNPELGAMIWGGLGVIATVRQISVHYQNHTLLTSCR